MTTTHPQGMTREEQIAFVRSLTTTILASVEYKINAGEIPATWDGIELRWYLSRRFESNFASDSKKRKREYNNLVITNDL